MILAVSVRKLNEGVSFEQFREAWTPDSWPEGLRHVYHARAVEDPNTIVSIGVLDRPPSALEELRHEPAEDRRQQRLAELVESAAVDAAFEVIEEIEP